MKISTLWGEEESEGKICRECGEEKHLDEFYKKSVVRSLSNPLQNYEAFCKKCDAKRASERYFVRKMAPPKPDACQCSGEKITKLFSDHDHVTKKFRGWLCQSCNLGLGQLGDSLEGVMKAVRYFINLLDSYEKEKVKKYIIRLVESM